MSTLLRPVFSRSLPLLRTSTSAAAVAVTRLRPYSNTCRSPQSQQQSLDRRPQLLQQKHAQAHAIPSLRHASTSSGSSPINKTALYDLHVQHGAKMVPFAGFTMPLQYSDLSHVESHHWTREKASIFDVSHMVQHQLSGPGATELLMKVTPSSLHTLKDNHATLSCLLDPETGGIIDDTVITRQGPDSFYFVTNAGRREEDLAFLAQEIEAFKKVKGEDSLKWDILHDRAMIALQGPAAAGALQPLIADAANVDTDLSTLVFGTSRSLNLTLPDGTSPQILISRTGYTGEDGFELSIPTTPDATLPTRVVTALLATPSGAVKLAGLAARDSLRLEAGMCLYGNDITTKQTPPTASLGWLVGKDRRDPSSPLANFNGASVILPQLASPAKTLTERRVGLVVQEAGPAARAGTPLVDLADGVTQIGTVTSGLPSPSLGGKNIAMAYVKQGLHKKGTEVGVLLRKKVRRATVTAMPFVPNKFYRG